MNQGVAAVVEPIARKWKVRPPADRKAKSRLVETARSFEVIGPNGEVVDALHFHGYLSSPTRTERCRCSDLWQRAAVDDPFGAGDLFRQRGHEVGDDSRHIFGLADVPCQQGTQSGHDLIDGAFPVGAECLGDLVAEATWPLVERSAGHPGSHDVRAHALRGELD